MPYDITMCGAGECPQKNNCIRFTGIIYGRTDFFGTPPYNKTSGICDHFLSDKPKYDFIAKLAFELWQKDGSKSGNDQKYWLEAENILIQQYRNS